MAVVQSSHFQFFPHGLQKWPPAVHSPLRGSVQDPPVPESTGFCFLSFMPFPWDLTPQFFFSFCKRWFSARNCVALETKHFSCAIVFYILTYISYSNNSLFCLWTANYGFTRILLRLSCLHGVISKDSFNLINRQKRFCKKVGKTPLSKTPFFGANPTANPTGFFGCFIFT